MALSEKTTARVHQAAIVLLWCVALIGGAVFAQGSCSGAATQDAQARMAKAELDLCRLRAISAGLEVLDPTLQPDAGSARAELEAAEDRLCSHVRPGVVDSAQAGAP